MPIKPKIINGIKSKYKKNNKKKDKRVYDKQSWRGQNGLRMIKLKLNPLCEYCERKGLIVVATHVDHIDGNNVNADIDNLQSLCKPCHSSKTVKHDGGFGNKIDRVGGG